MAIDLPLARTRGDTAPHGFTIKSVATGDPVDITGYGFKLSVDSTKNPVDEDTQLFQLTGAITDAENGKVAFSPTADQADQTPKSYYYDVEMTDAGGAILTILKSKYVFTQDITK